MVFKLFFLGFTFYVFGIISSYAAALGSELQSTYVVFMNSQKMKALEASLASTSRTWYEEIIESISISNQDDDQSSPPPQHHYTYNNIIPAGFSAKLTDQQLESLERVDGFVSAIRDELRTLHTTHSPQFLGLHEGHGLWSPQNLASDVIIGLVDSGIWPEHPSFNDSGLSCVPSRWKGACQTGTEFKASNCNKKLIGAAAFFKGYESANGRINKTTDYRSARDSQGHGTHTASTAGGKFVRGANFSDWANGTAAGMRPTARIASYKACFELGCYDSDILAAMEQAVQDGVEVLSLSMGMVARPYYNDSIAIGAFGAIRNGVIVSVSAGNEGPNSSTVENVAPWLMTVAASTTDRSFPAQVRLGDGRIFNGTTLCSGKSTTKSLPTVHDETSRNTTLCVMGSLSPKLVKGKIVICVRGNISIFEKGEAVKAAGGAGMILADRVGYDVLSFDFAFEFGILLPAILLGISDANAVIRYTKNSSSTSTPPTATIEFQDAFGNRAPVMASFSSRGPNLVDLNILKPDVTAPGVNILAAWPPNVSPTELKSDNRRGLYNIISGTSMSCPHVSGVMALLKSLHPDWSPAAIKSALMTTAYVYDSQNKPISDKAALVSNGSESASPFAFGSGHIDPERAADPGLIYDISPRDYLNYLCGLGYNSTQMAHFVGKENKANCPPGSHIRPGDLNYPSFSLVFNTKFRGTTSYMRTVTNVGIGGVSNYSVKVTAPKGVSISIHPKVLKFSEMGEKLSYNVAFKARRGKVDEDFTFGYLEWVSSCDRKYSVRSPVAVTWIQ